MDEAAKASRGELMSISLTTMTYPSLEEDLDCHKKESAHPLLGTKDFINKHGSYFLTIPSNPCSYEKSPKPIGLSIATHEIFNPLTLHIHKDFERVVIDAFV